MPFRSLRALVPVAVLVLADPAVAYLCGDLNGNKEVTAGDALSALKLSVGQSIATSCGPQHRVLVTGQTQCTNAEGSLTSCEGTGQDGELRKGAPRAFVDNGDGTVTDRGTGLQWELFDDAGGLHDKENALNWTGAFAKVAALNLASFAGHNDWRLPNIFELMTLGNFGQNDPGLYTPYFQHDCVADCALPDCACVALPSYEWASTSYAYQPNLAWALQMRFGDPLVQGKGLGTYRARAVRGGYTSAEINSEPALANSCADVNASDTITAPDALAILRKSVGQDVDLTCLLRSSPLVTGQTKCYGETGLEIPCLGTGQDGELQRGVERSFSYNLDGTIVDGTTGLVWEILTDDGTVHDHTDTFNFTQAQPRIDELNDMSFAGRTDWRVPNFAEIESLLNFGSATTGVYDVYFNADCEEGCTNTQCSCLPAMGVLWSSTSPPFHGEYALTTDLSNAHAAWQPKSDGFGVRGVAGGD